MRLLLSCLAGLLAALVFNLLLGMALGPWVRIFQWDWETTITYARAIGPWIATFFAIAVGIFIFNGGTFERAPASTVPRRADNG
jgi:hypothetical protein